MWYRIHAIWQYDTTNTSNYILCAFILVYQYQQPQICRWYATLMAESEEELKSLLMSMKRREWKSWLKTQHSKTKIMASGPITSWQTDGEKVGAVIDLIFFNFGLQNHCGWWLQSCNSKMLPSRRKAMVNLETSFCPQKFKQSTLLFFQ